MSSLLSLDPGATTRAVVHRMLVLTDTQDSYLPSILWFIAEIRSISMAYKAR